jgi:hypothetical protein
MRAAGIRRGRRERAAGRWPAGTASPTPGTPSPVWAPGGLSNPRIGDRLYASRRTVQTHHAHVFAKLDITSRTQLAAEVAQHRDSESPDSTGPVGA